MKKQASNPSNASSKSQDTQRQADELKKKMLKSKDVARKSE